MYSSIEEVEGKGIFTFLREIEEARRPGTRLRRAIGFAAKCMTKVNVVVPASARNGGETTIRANTRNPEIARLANAYLADGRSNSLAALLKEIRRAPDVDLIRADLFNRVLGVLRTHAMHPNMTLQEAGEQYQRNSAIGGGRSGIAGSLGQRYL